MAKKHFLKCSISLTTKDMKIKTKMTFVLSQSEWQMTVSARTNEGKANSHSLLVRGWTDAATVNISESRSPTRPSHITSDWKDNKTTLDPARDTCSSMFTNAQLTITATKRKQPRCLSIYEWIMRICYIYTMQYYSAKETIICNSEVNGGKPD